MHARGLGLLAGLALLGCGRDPVPEKPRAAPEPRPSAVKFVAPLKPDVLASATPAAATPQISASPLPASPAPSPGAATVEPARLVSYPPKDECAGLPGFAAFRGKLAAAVRKRDSEAVAGLANADVKLDFGGGAGRDELQRRLGARPELWDELQEMLPLGCAADNGLATLPWIFSRMPEDVDPYRGMLVAGEKVPLRERADADAPVRGEVDWVLVTPVAERADPKARFVEVETADKTLRGFVEADKLRGLLDYRVVAEPQGEGWAISAFIAGD